MKLSKYSRYKVGNFIKLHQENQLYSFQKIQYPRVVITQAGNLKENK
jgi:hypothetical protein